MSYEVTGEIHLIGKTEQITDTFKKRLIVISSITGQYTEYIPIEFTQDKCELLDKFQKGETVAVKFNLRGREWQGKFFVNLNGWRIEKRGGEVTQATEQKPPEKINDTKVNDDSQLPF